MHRSGLAHAAVATLALALFQPAIALAADAIPSRTPLRSVPIAPGKLVSRVETTRVDFAPGQIMPRHKHLVPVLCFIAKGNFLVKIGDAAERPETVGDVTLEAAGETVQYFKNASATEPAELLCASLAGDGDTVLNVMLDR